MQCFMCRNDSISEQYDVYRSATTHSHTILIKFITRVINNGLRDLNSAVLCKLCYALIDEYDLAEQTCVRIKERLIKYLSQHFNTRNIKEEKLVKEENVVDTVDELPACDSPENVKSNETPVNKKQKKKLYECATCRKKFASKNGISLHIARQHKTEKNDGEVSDESVKNEMDGKKRKQRSASITVKPLKYTCTQCPKMWRTAGELRNHEATHSQDRPYICEVCGQAYKHKAALDVHVGMHYGINPFSCEFCHKAFTQKGALQRHLPIHTGQAPYQCDLCGKRFVHHTSFNMHTLAHTGQKSYKCSLCGLALLSGSHLKRHSRVHTGEKRFACTHCGKRFAERYNLVAHQHLHNGPRAREEVGQQLHQCPICFASFNRKLKLEEHLLNDHNKISDSDQSRKWDGNVHTAPPVNCAGRKWIDNILSVRLNE